MATVAVKREIRRTGKERDCNCDGDPALLLVANPPNRESSWEDSTTNGETVGYRQLNLKPLAAEGWAPWSDSLRYITDLKHYKTRGLIDKDSCTYWREAKEDSLQIFWLFSPSITETRVWGSRRHRNFKADTNGQRSNVEFMTAEWQ